MTKLNNEICELSLEEINEVTGGGECFTPVHVPGGTLIVDYCSRTINFIPDKKA